MMRKRIPLKFEGKCRSCGKTIAQGGYGWWAKGQGVECDTCYTAAAAAPASPPFIPPQSSGVAPAVPPVVTKSCDTCPSLVRAVDTRDLFGTDLGADVCFRHEYILSRTGVDPEAIHEHYASKCDEHGEPRPASSQLVAVPVAVPVDPPGERPSFESQPTTCTGCKFFIKSPMVRAEYGWNLGMCAAKGNLVYPRGLTSEALNCGLGVAGVELLGRSSDFVALFPHYWPTAGAGANQASATSRFGNHEYDHDAAMDRHSVDPRKYETDREVTEAEAESHIRAWRRVDSPDGGEPAWLPIFNGTELCGFDPRDTYGNHSPELYTDHQALLYELTAVMVGADFNPVLIGPAGSGKTELGCHFAWLMDLPYYRISVDKGTESWHLAGEAELAVDDDGNNITRWKMGRFSDKYDKPGIIMVDEPNLKSEIFEFLRPALDSANQLVLDANQGTVIERGAYTFLMLSQNPSWDPIYVGVEPMSAADMDRVVPIATGLPPEDIEREIIAKHCAVDGYEIESKTLDYMMQIADDIRQFIGNDTLQIAWGLRAQIKVAKLSRFFPLEKAYRRAITDGLEQDAAQKIIASVEGVVS